MVKECNLSFNEIDTSVNLNTFLLVSYDILIGMDWMESHKTNINFLNKSFDGIAKKTTIILLKEFTDMYPYNKSQLCNSKNVLEKDVKCMYSK